MIPFTFRVVALAAIRRAGVIPFTTQVAAEDVGGVEPDGTAAGEGAAADGHVHVDSAHDRVVFGAGW